MDEESFLAAIASSPEDRSLRAIYADWLEERGDSRAELLRVVERMSQLPVITGEYRKLRVRRDELRRGGDFAWQKAVLRPTISELRRRVEEIVHRYAEQIADQQKHGGSLELSLARWRDARLDPPATLALVERVEAHLGCTLPDQYRRFVLELTDGGVGPDSWIEPLARFLNPNFAAHVAEPFPADGYDPNMLYEFAEYLDGALPITRHPADGEFYLVVTGPNRGEIWTSALPVLDSLTTLSVLQTHPADYRARVLAVPRYHRLEFLDWYAQWVDETLWDISCQDTPETELSDHLTPSVTELLIEDRKLSALPPALRSSPWIKRLSLHHLELTALPDWLGELKNLETLSLVNNPVQHLPPSLGQLVELREADLSYCRLEDLPLEIGDCRQLETLNLANNRLRSLPESIVRLSKLRNLDLRGNRLTELPPGLGQLSHLERLDLSNNSLRTLSGGLGASLVYLYLDGNRDLDLADACRKLSQVTGLRHLTLRSNALHALPREIGLLTQLTGLDLSGNNLTGLPDEMAQLTHLETLVIDSRSPRLRSRKAQLFPNLPPTPPPYEEHPQSWLGQLWTRVLNSLPQPHIVKFVLYVLWGVGFATFWVVVYYLNKR